MATIRVYKLAAELGIERTDIVERAAGVGIELRSAMASLEDDIANELRRKLGGQTTEREIVTERRVQRGSGAAVIRRRRKVEPEPEPIPEPAAMPAAVTAEARSHGPGALPEEPAAAGEVAAAEASPEVSEPEVEVQPIAAKARQEDPAAPGPGARPGARDRSGSAAPAGPRPTTGPGTADRKGAGQRKLVREVVNLREQESLARQATSRGQVRRQVTIDPRTAASPRRKRRDALPPPASSVKAAAQKDAKRVVRVDGAISVGELARELGAKAPEVQRRLMALGTMVAINQTIDVETATQVAAEFDYEVQDVGFDETRFIPTVDESGDDEALAPRPPVVTVMGHVDHGKTSLLDAIRNSNVVSGEAGGITQHIGAYQVSLGDRSVTFIDTPGHAAFAEMRGRGAAVTDIVILVIAATEGIMPQTIESIQHSQAAGVPIVVAVNKCDLPGANPQQARQRLMEHNLVPEDFGGDTICVDVSATEGTNLDKLLEMVHLQAELLELKADPKRRAEGVVLEARLDRGRGPVSTILVQRGTLRRGDMVVMGTSYGRVRAMEDENGKRVVEAGPSVPVQLTGLSDVAEAGETFAVVESERVAKEIIAHREAERRIKVGAGPARPKLTLEQIFAAREGGGIKELPIVIKADVQGSVEALRDSLTKLSTDAVKLDVLLTGVGAVSETDVMLARASGAIIVAFHVRPDPAARKAADSQGVEIRTYQVIYDVVDEVKLAMEGLLPPTIREEIMGMAEVRDTFTVPKVGTIAGCYVTEGTIRRSSNCRLLRDGVQIYDGKVGSLKRFKDDARDVASGFECGIGIDGYNDIKVGDVIEAYSLEEERATL